MHTLNNCSAMSEQGRYRYTWCHISILYETYQTLLNFCEGWDIIVALPDHTSMVGLSPTPCDNLPTTQKPNIVVINRDMQIIIFIELTV